MAVIGANELTPAFASFSPCRLLLDFKKEKVVLYVGHDNSAQRVYDRVGFAGLCGKPKPDGVEDSLELGFVGTDRGYW